MSIVSRFASITFVPNSRVRGDEVIECRSNERSKLVVGRAASGALVTGEMGVVVVGVIGVMERELDMVD